MSETIDLATYNGGSTRLPEEPFCRNCDATLHQESALRCSRCSLVHYCNQKCQKEHFPAHKRMCKGMRQLYDKLEVEASKLRSTTCNSATRTPENLFETSVGKFWYILGTRDYMNARCDVFYACKAILNSEKKDNKLALEFAMEHNLGLLRLCHGDNKGVRYATPFVLLRLNRDDHAYSACRYWLKEQFSMSGNQRTLTQADGDWPFPFEENCRFNDICEELGRDESDSELTRVCMFSMVAIFIIKIRIVAALEGRKLREGQAFADDVKLAEQRDMRIVLMNIIDRNNPTMLRALLHPGPLLSKKSPDFWQSGSPSEAATVMEEALVVWDATPGARALLVEKFGTEKPSYSCEMRF
ncbi:hypothetical protein MPSEU_001013900 [Mayamaea pseudoterrestris]|nr:hypothetical protein MPSEU_001013900 [Mayamaea pseudoterrestris]